MIDKEKNFISALVYLHNGESRVIGFVDELNKCLGVHFNNYEIIVVDDCCTDCSVTKLKAWASGLELPLTLIHMSIYHGLENAMNAGLDASIGDYVFEFDSIQAPYDFRIVFEAYSKAIEGNDIVCVCPSETRNGSKLFYKLFNANSESSYQLRTDAFRVVSRRAINRVHASNAYLPYRKAAYAASGLKMSHIDFNGKVESGIQKRRSSTAIDSLILYTNAGYRISIGITIFMMVIALFELVYTIAVYCNGHPIEGWTTTMLVMTFGFLGLFFVFSIVIRYLSLSINLAFRKQKYLIESIEKIQ